MLLASPPSRALALLPQLPRNRSSLGKSAGSEQRASWSARKLPQSRQSSSSHTICSQRRSRTLLQLPLPLLPLASSPRSRLSETRQLTGKATPNLSRSHIAKVDAQTIP